MVRRMRNDEPTLVRIISFVVARKPRRLTSIWAGRISRVSTTCNRLSDRHLDSRLTARFRILGTTLMVMAVSVAGAAWACDDDSDAAFILRSGDGSTQMIGSLDDLHHVRRAFRDDNNVILWTRIDGDEYLVSDPAILARAREIFRQSEPLDAKQEEIEKDMKEVQGRQESLEAEEERLDQRQELLDAEQDRVSRAMTRDLERLMRDAIRSGKASKP